MVFTVIIFIFIWLIVKNKSKKYIIYENLYNKIINNDYQIGDPLPSENELSDLFCVSRMTAREAITMLINKGVAERVQGKGSFVKSNSPIKKEVVMILPGMVEPEDDTYFYYQTNVYKLLSSIESGARKHGFNLIIKFSDFKKNTEKENLKDVINHRPDALIVYTIGDEETNHLIKTLKDLGVFVLMIDIYKEDICNAYCSSDNYALTMDLLKKVYGQNPGKIEFYTYDREASSVIQRNKAYKDFALSHNIYEEKLIHKIPWIPEIDMQIVTKEYILSNKIGYNNKNVFFSVSAMFGGYVLAAEKLGVDISDKKFASVDLSPMGEKYNLMSTQQDWISIGTKAAEMIDNYFNNKLKVNYYLVGAIKEGEKSE